MLNPLGSLCNRQSDSHRRHRESLRQWLMQYLQLSEETIISLNEVTCLEPECPPRETVIAILTPGQKIQQHKLHLALLDIQPSDLEGLF